MIPVDLAPEPKEFDGDVRQPGLSAIDEMVGRSPRTKRPGPKRAQLATPSGQPMVREEDIPAYKFPPYWRRALPAMVTAYQSRCAYLAMRIYPATGSPSVDHMLPKSRAWDQVYEWSNYRLCAQSINAKKGASEKLVDPFDVEMGWFTLNLYTAHVERGDAAPAEAWARIDATLPLLNQRPCVQLRQEYLRAYRNGPAYGEIGLVYLERVAPFIAAELRRQGQLLRDDT